MASRFRESGCLLLACAESDGLLTKEGGVPESPLCTAERLSCDVGRGPSQGLAAGAGWFHLRFGNTGAGKYMGQKAGHFGGAVTLHHQLRRFGRYATRAKRSRPAPTQVSTWKFIDQNFFCGGPIRKSGRCSRPG